VGLIVNGNWVQMADAMLGWMGIDICGDDGRKYGRWPWQIPGWPTPSGVEEEEAPAEEEKAEEAKPAKPPEQKAEKAAETPAPKPSKTQDAPRPVKNAGKSSTAGQPAPRGDSAQNPVRDARDRGNLGAQP
jgi:outer membrane biosynthesis protein TonB